MAKGAISTSTSVKDFQGTTAWLPIVTLDLHSASSTAFDEAVTKFNGAATAAKTKGLPDLNFETGVVTITPQLAEQCLLRNGGNRRVQLSHVKRLANIMVEGGWKLAQPWLWDGTLQDAQHRAWAVYLSGTTIQTTFVVVPKQDQLFAVIDTGRGRSPGDALYTAGSTTQFGPVSKAISLLWRYDNDALGVWKQPKIRKMENTEVLDYAHEHPGIEEAAHLVAGSFPKVSKIAGNAGVAVAFAYLVTELYGEQVLSDFYGPLASGANLSEYSPILALRNRLQRVDDDEGKMPAPHRLALMIRGFTLHHEGKEVGKKGLYLRDNEKYPRLEPDANLAAAE